MCRLLMLGNERRTQHQKQGDMLLIRSNKFLTNQMRSRVSTGLPELPNHLKTGPCTCISHGGPPSSQQTEDRAKQAQPTVGRPTRSPDQVVARCDRSSMAVWLISRARGWWLPPINTRGGGENRDTLSSWSSQALQAFSLV